MLGLRWNDGLSWVALHLATTTTRPTEVQLLDMHSVLVKIRDVLAEVAPTCRVRLIATAK